MTDQQGVDAGRAGQWPESADAEPSSTESTGTDPRHAESMDAESSHAVSEHLRRLVGAVEEALVGKRDVVDLVVAGLLTRGHVLLEDRPGLGKTLLARSMAEALSLDFARVQFTPDLLPGDVTGGAVFDPRDRTFDFVPGPVFANVVLADEVNRAPPKTQAALLEAMEERQVTVDGVTHPLPDPFVVIATQNPIEFEGTYPLPEAQLDRFRLRARLGYPGDDDEWEVVGRRLGRRSDDQSVPAVLAGDDVRALQRAVEDVHVEGDVGRYAVALARATREVRGVTVGSSPRGSLSLVLLARARALQEGRDHVVTDDVRAMAVPALAHRLVLDASSWVEGITPEDVVTKVLEQVAVPATVPTST